ncbi:MAG: plasmid recombination protein [Oscillospiraceae bacterium]|nr:plasmid recombination protein [Oscillospiraceae bacterium]
MMANYGIIRIEKRKIGSVGRICNHHERLKEQYKSNPDIDSVRTHLNYHLVKPDKKYRELVLARIQQAGAKMRKDSVVMQDGLITASPEWIKANLDAEQAEYFNYAFEFVKERYGIENIISAVVHLDEATPHMHFVFVPITKDNRLSSKDIMGGPKGMAKLQDDFHAYISEKYPDLERGIPKAVSHRKHIPAYMFKNATELYNHYNEICNAINDIGLIGNAKKKDEAIALLGKYAPEMAKLKDQLKTTDKHIESLEKELKTEFKINKMYQSKTYTQELEIDKLNNALYELNAKQKKLEKVISLIPPELLEQLVKTEQQNRRIRNNGER